MDLVAPIAEVRPLTAAERRLIECLLANAGETARAFLPQLSEASVVSRCHCGCPTIDLAVAGRTAPDGANRILASLDTYSPEGVRAGVLLHARNGLLAEIEVYSMAGDERPFTLPEPESVCAGMNAE